MDREARKGRDVRRETAPTSFRRNEEIGLSIVFQQPETLEERERVHDAMHSCPTDSIGNDGDTQ